MVVWSARRALASSSHARSTRRCSHDRGSSHRRQCNSQTEQRRLMPPPARYNTGYNVGVGGAVVHDGRLLLVRRASRRGRGNWQVPGGFIEPDETVEQAVIREVVEEAGVTAEVEGILGLRNRCDPDVGNSLYIVLLLRPLSGEPKPDGKEVDRAAYFSLDEIRMLEQVPSINLEIAQRALSADKRLLMPQTLMHHVTGAPYMLFVG